MTIAPDPDAWRHQAACIGRIDVFARTMSPTTSRRKSTWQRNVEQAAIAICNTCPVRVQCLDAELATMRDGVRSYGVFGGLTSDERRRICRDACREYTAHYRATLNERSST